MEDRYRLTDQGLVARYLQEDCRCSAEGPGRHCEEGKALWTAMNAILGMGEENYPEGFLDNDELFQAWSDNLYRLMDSPEYEAAVAKWQEHLGA